MSQQAKTDVIINAEQAKAQLKEIQNELVKVKSLRDKALAEGDVKGFNTWSAEFKKLTSDATKMQKSTKDVSDILKNLSSASVRELNAAYQQMNRELKDMKRNNPEYAEKQKQVKALKTELDNANGSMGKQGVTLKGLIGTVGGWAAGLGLAVGAMEAVKGIISATDTVSDKFEETIGGMKNGMHYFAVALTSLDFSNFLTNMRAAIKAGNEYVQALDAIGDRTRGLEIVIADDAKRIADLDIISKDVTKSKEVRKAAIIEILQLEQKNADLSVGIAKDKASAELKYAANQTGLSEERIRQMLKENTIEKDKVEQAKKYLDAVNVLRQNEVSKGATTEGWILNFFTKDEKALEDAKRVIENTTPAVKKNAEELYKLGKVGEDSYKAIADAVKDAGMAEAAYATDNNKRITRLNKINKGQLDDEEATAKEQIKIVKESTKTLSQLIADKDAEIEAAIQAGNIPLAEKFQIEKKAMEDLLETYKKVKEAIAAGWDMNQRGSGVIESLASKGIKGVKSDKPGGSPLGYVDNNLSGQPSDQAKATEDAEQQRRNDWRDAEYQMANNINATVFNMVMNRQQAELDHKITMLEKQKQAELSNKNLTEAQKLAIEEKYDTKTRALKLAQWKKERNASAVNTAIATILAVMKAGGPLNPVGAVTALAGALAVAEILAKKPPEFYQGGYTGDGTDDRKLAGTVHFNEFVGSAKAVRNPSIKPVFDVIDYAQRNGTISQINLPALVANSTAQGRKAGGYVSDATNNAFSAGSASNTDYLIMKEFTEELRRTREEGLRGKWSLNDLEKIQKDKSDIQSATEM